MKAWKQVHDINRKFKCNISYRAFVSVDPASIVHIGTGSSVGPGTVIITQGYDRKIKTEFRVGRSTYIGENNNIRVADASVIIGDHCMISQMVSLISTNHHIGPSSNMLAYHGLDYQKTGITIGNDVWVGCNAVIMPGTTIGDGAVVGAGSVVTGDVEPYHVVAGNPARTIRIREKA